MNFWMNHTQVQDQLLDLFTCSPMCYHCDMITVLFSPKTYDLFPLPLHSAIGRGTDMLELDVHITADEEVVVCHDNCLKRTTGHDILVTETFYHDLPMLKPELPLDFDRGMYLYTYTIQYWDFE